MHGKSRARFWSSPDLRGFTPPSTGGRQPAYLRGPGSEHCGYWAALVRVPLVIRFSQLPASSLVDRLGPHRLLSYGLALRSLAQAFAGLVTNVAAFTGDANAGGLRLPTVFCQVAAASRRDGTGGGGLVDVDRQEAALKAQHHPTCQAWVLIFSQASGSSKPANAAKTLSTSAR